MPAKVPRLGWFRSLVAAIGAQVVYALIRLFGRKRQMADIPWLAGPLGDEHIGDAPYAQCAASEGLTVTRDAKAGGLIPDFEALRGPHFDPDKVAPVIRDFYENTAQYRMDVWSQTSFPMNIGLWLLVTTISRKVDQLNFPVAALDSAQGMTSEIVLLKKPDGSIRYTGWFRKLAASDRVLYTGFYMTECVPAHEGGCVKVVFPMPRGNATVVLRPVAGDNGELELVSAGRAFGDVGFYRLQQAKDGFRVWRIASLKEHFRLYVDGEGVLRCDHVVWFLGLRVLTLHYRIERR